MYNDVMKFVFSYEYESVSQSTRSFWNMTSFESELMTDRLMLSAGRRRWLCEAISCWNHLGTSDEFPNVKDASTCVSTSSTNLCVYIIIIILFFNAY